MFWVINNIPILRFIPSAQSAQVTLMHIQRYVYSQNGTSAPMPNNNNANHRN